MRALTAAMTFLSASLLATALPATAHADEELLAMIESLRAERRLIVEDTMAFSTAEGDAFWPVYDDYRSRLEAIVDRRVALTLDFIEDPDSFTDEKSRDVLDELIELEAARIEVAQSFVDRFGSVIPQRKVFRFYQLENKLDLLIQSELSKAIPLVE